MCPYHKSPPLGVRGLRELNVPKSDLTNLDFLCESLSIFANSLNLGLTQIQQHMQYVIGDIEV